MKLGINIIKPFLFVMLPVMIIIMLSPILCAQDNAKYGLIEAAAAGNLSKVRELLDRGEYINDTDKPSEIQIAVTPEGKTMFVGPEGYIKLGDFIIKPPLGSQLKPLYPGGFSALMKASEKGHLEIAKILLQRGACVNCGNNDGFTALILACMNGHKEIVRVLLDHGANRYIMTKTGTNAYEQANRKGYSEILELIKTYKGNSHNPFETSHCEARAFEELDYWVKLKWSGSTRHDEEFVRLYCESLVRCTANDTEKTLLYTTQKDELNHRIDVCTRMTVNRVNPQPEFTKKETIDSICDSNVTLFKKLCWRYGFR